MPKYSAKKQSNNRKTIKKVRKITKSTPRMESISNGKKSHIVRIFLEILNVVKLFHWKTKSYAQHKATDELYAKLNEHIDTFVEILLGKDESRIKTIEKKCNLVNYNNTKDFKQKVYEFRDFLIDISNHFDSSKDSDLLNVRDEILGDINQFLYLLTFNK
jgi:hypothetical protein